jgi:hypothetical protein
MTILVQIVSKKKQPIHIFQMKQKVKIIKMTRNQI